MNTKRYTKIFSVALCAFTALNAYAEKIETGNIIYEVAVQLR